MHAETQFKLYMGSKPRVTPTYEIGTPNRDILEFAALPKIEWPISALGFGVELKLSAKRKNEHKEILQNFN